MHKTLLLTTALTTFALGTQAAPETYKVDTVHSHVLFKVKHLNVAYSYGEFNDFEGTATLDREAPQNSSLEIVIKADSIDTKNAKRDQHLKNADFFNVPQYPTITFKSTSVKKDDDDELDVTGDLTLMGVTKPITVELDIVGEGKGMKGETRAGVHGDFKIKRSDFGMTGMQNSLGDEVEVTVSLEAIKQ